MRDFENLVKFARKLEEKSGYMDGKRRREEQVYRQNYLIQVITIFTRKMVRAAQLCRRQKKVSFRKAQKREKNKKGRDQLELLYVYTNRCPLYFGNTAAFSIFTYIDFGWKGEMKKYRKVSVALEYPSRFTPCDLLTTTRIDL